MFERRHFDGFDLLVCGTEVHVDLHRPGVVTRRAARDALRPLLRDVGFATTRVDVGDERSRRFVTKIGFKPTWSNETHEFFMLDSEPFSR